MRMAVDVDYGEGWCLWGRQPETKNPKRLFCKTKTEKQVPILEEIKDIKQKPESVSYQENSFLPSFEYFLLITGY